MYAQLTVSPSKPARPGLGGACCSSCAEHGGSCGGLGRGVQEYLPVSWQKELAAFSLGGPIPPPSPGVQGLMDSWGAGTVLMVGGGALLLMMALKRTNRRRKSRAAFRRVRGY